MDIPLEENQMSPEDEMRIDAISDCAKEFSSEEDQVQMENGLDISSLVALENDDWPGIVHYVCDQSAQTFYNLVGVWVVRP